MFITKLISITDSAYIERSLKQFAPLFSEKMGVPVTFEMGRRKEYSDVYRYSFSIERSGLSVLSDILYPNGLVWCNILIDHSRGFARMRNMETGWGRSYRKKGFQRLFQSIIYSTLHIQEVRFIDTYAKGQKFIDRSGIFFDKVQIPSLKKYPDVACKVDLERCRALIAEFKNNGRL